MTSAEVIARLLKQHGWINRMLWLSEHNAGLAFTVGDDKETSPLYQRAGERFEKAFEDRSQRLKKLSEKFSAGLLSFSTADNVMSVLGRAYSKKRSNARNSNNSNTSGGD